MHGGAGASEDDDVILQVIKVNKFDQQQEDMIPEYTLHDKTLHNVRNTMSHKRQVSHDLNLVQIENNDCCDYSKSLVDVTDNKDHHKTS